MEGKIRQLTIESGHGRKPRRNAMLFLTKEAEILRFEILSFRRLCISWKPKLVVLAIYCQANENSEWLENSFFEKEVFDDLQLRDSALCHWAFNSLDERKEMTEKVKLDFSFSDLALRCSQLTFCIRQPLEQASHNQMCRPLFCGPEHRRDNLILNRLRTAKNSWQFDPFYPWLLFFPMTKGK